MHRHIELLKDFEVGVDDVLIDRFSIKQFDDLRRLDVVLQHDQYLADEMWLAPAQVEIDLEIRAAHFLVVLVKT